MTICMYFEDTKFNQLVNKQIPLDANIFIFKVDPKTDTLEFMS